MAHSSKFWLIGVVSIACLVVLGYIITFQYISIQAAMGPLLWHSLRPMTSGPKSRHSLRPTTTPRMSWHIQGRGEPPDTSQSYLVGKYGEDSHPYYLSPVLQFPNDIFRRRTMFNLTGIKSRFSVNQVTEKLILFYNMPDWYHMHIIYRIGLQNCPVKCCKVSGDKTLLSQAHAVIFYVYSPLTHQSPPPKATNQMWIFFSHEPPWDFPRWNKVFNWTMTFRFDSDIIIPYFVIVQKENPDVRNFTSITKTKSAPIMWLVSHCNARSGRDDYVRQLQKHIKVDVYGRCGPFKCSPRGQGGCEDIQNKYKFYLAFENSLCRGYITEKLFRCYQIDIIPVVRGGARYSELLPHGTFINTADFRSAKHLAEYLHYLDNNDTAYADILQKKSQFTITKPKKVIHSSVCDICIKLHNLERFANEYYDMNKWWNGNSCMQARDL